MSFRQYIFNNNIMPFGEINWDKKPLKIIRDNLNNNDKKLEIYAIHDYIEKDVQVWEEFLQYLENRMISLNNLERRKGIRHDTNILYDDWLKYEVMIERYKTLFGKIGRNYTSYYQAVIVDIDDKYPELKTNSKEQSEENR